MRIGTLSMALALAAGVPVLLSSAAMADPVPGLSGTYDFTYVETCQALIVPEGSSVVTGLDLDDGNAGTMSELEGKAVFTPTSAGDATSGIFTVKGSQEAGDLIAINGKTGKSVKEEHFNLPVGYATASDTFSFTPKTGNPSHATVTLSAIYLGVSGTSPTIAAYVEFSGIDIAPGCYGHGTAILDTQQ